MSKSRIPQQSQVIPPRNGAGANRADIDGDRGNTATRSGLARKGAFRSAIALSVVALFGAGYFAGQVLPVGGDGARDLGAIPMVAGSSSLLPGSISADQIGRSADDRDADSGRSADAAQDRAATDRAATDRAAANRDPDRSAGADDRPATIGGDDADRTTGGRATADGSSERDWVLQGDIIEIADEEVLVCATGNGFGISHIGTTLSEDADGEATRAEKDRLCATAFTVVGGLVLSGADQGSMLEEERDVAIGATSATCVPVEDEDKVLRCTANDDSLVTVWSVAP